MDVGTAGERIADAPADAGGRAAEGLDLGGVVVRFVFEHQKPVLLLAVHHGGYMDGAGVDLLALVELGEQTADLLSVFVPMVAISISVCGRWAAFSAP